MGILHTTIISVKNTVRRFVELQRIIRFFMLDSFLEVVESHTTPRTLLIIRLDGIGDYLLFRNFLKEILKSDRFRGYDITLCGNESCKNIAESFDSRTVSDFIWINTNKFKRHAFYRWNKLSEIRKRGFAVVVSPVYSRDSIREDSIVRISGSKEKIGCKGDFIHAKPWEKKIFDRYYTELIDISPSNTFEFLKTKEFFEKLLLIKIDTQKPSLPLIISGEETGRVAVICPGALLQKKRWPLKCFIEIIDYLHAKHNISSILVGNRDDIPSTADTLSIAERPYIQNLIGRTSLFETTGIVQNSILVVTNDTSVSHIGVASDKPVVVVSNGEHYGRFSEYPKEIFSKIYYAYPPEIADSAMSFSELVNKYQYGSRLRIDKIKVETVRQLIDKALSEK